MWGDYISELRMRDLMESGGRASVVPSVLVSRPAWMSRGACRAAPEISFFPARGESAEPAKRLCIHSCPVVDECKAYALGDPDLQGVWGGTSARERRVLRTEAGPKGRRVQPKTCRRGHSLDEKSSNVYINEEGKRFCRACRRETKARYLRNRLPANDLPDAVIG